MMCDDPKCNCQNNWETSGSDEYKEIIKNIKLKDSLNRRLKMMSGKIDGVISQLEQIKRGIEYDYSRNC